MFNYYLKNISNSIKIFIKNRRASDDKNTGSAMAMIFAVVIGFLLLTSVYSFFNRDFLPNVFQKLNESLNFTG